MSDINTFVNKMAYISPRKYYELDTPRSVVPPIASGSDYECDIEFDWMLLTGPFGRGMWVVLSQWEFTPDYFDRPDGAILSDSTSYWRLAYYNESNIYGVPNRFLLQQVGMDINNNIDAITYKLSLNRNFNWRGGFFERGKLYKLRFVLYREAATGNKRVNFFANGKLQSAYTTNVLTDTPSPNTPYAPFRVGNYYEGNPNTPSVLGYNPSTGASISNPTDEQIKEGNPYWYIGNLRITRALRPGFADMAYTPEDSFPPLSEDPYGSDVVILRRFDGSGDEVNGNVWAEKGVPDQPLPEGIRDRYFPTDEPPEDPVAEDPGPDEDPGPGTEPPEPEFPEETDEGVEEDREVDEGHVIVTGTPGDIVKLRAEGSLVAGGLPPTYEWFYRAPGTKNFRPLPNLTTQTITVEILPEVKSPPPGTYSWASYYVVATTSTYSTIKAITILDTSSDPDTPETPDDEDMLPPLVIGPEEDDDPSAFPGEEILPDLEENDPVYPAAPLPGWNPPTTDPGFDYGETDLTYRLRLGTYREPFHKNGTVILSRPLAAGESLSIERKTPITKDVSFTYLEEPDWNAFEYQIDKYTMICQEIEGHLCECLECVVPDASVSVETDREGQLVVSPNIPDESIRLDDEVTLTANILAGTPPFTYQWYRDAEAIEGETSQTYVFTYQGTGAEYSVVVGNECGEGSGLAVVSDEDSVEIPGSLPECKPYACDALSTYQESGDLFFPSGTTLGDVFPFVSGSHTIDLTSTDRWSLVNDPFVDACVDSPLVLRTINSLGGGGVFEAQNTLNDGGGKHIGVILKHGGVGGVPRSPPYLLLNDMRYLVTISYNNGMEDGFDDAGFDWTVFYTEDIINNRLTFYARVTDRDIGGDNNITIGSVDIDCTDPGVNSPSDRYMAITLTTEIIPYITDQFDFRCRYSYLVHVAYQDAGVVRDQVISREYNAGQVGYQPPVNSAIEEITFIEHPQSQYARSTRFLANAHIKTGKFSTSDEYINARLLFLTYLRNQSLYTPPDYC